MANKIKITVVKVCIAPNKYKLQETIILFGGIFKVYGLKAKEQPSKLNQNSSCNVKRDWRHGQRLKNNAAPFRVLQEKNRTGAFILLRLNFNKTQKNGRLFSFFLEMLYKHILILRTATWNNFKSCSSLREKLLFSFCEVKTNKSTHVEILTTLFLWNLSCDNDCIKKLSYRQNKNNVQRKVTGEISSKISTMYNLQE